jgi:hypothetical protein
VLGQCVHIYTVECAKSSGGVVTQVVKHLPRVCKEWSVTDLLLTTRLFKEEKQAGCGGVHL